MLAPLAPAERVNRAQGGKVPAALVAGTCLHPAPRAEGILDGWHFLVVDDLDLNLDYAEALLTGTGAWVTWARHGQEALDLLRERPGGWEVVLMDIRMPVMDGLTATRLIRAELGLTALPIIALTAENPRLLATDAAQAGIDAILEKPLSVPQLVTCLAEVRARKGPLQP